MIHKGVYNTVLYCIANFVQQYKLLFMFYALKTGTDYKIFPWQADGAPSKSSIAFLILHLIVSLIEVKIVASRCEDSTVDSLYHTFFKSWWNTSRRCCTSPSFWRVFSQGSQGFWILFETINHWIFVGLILLNAKNFSLFASHVAIAINLSVVFIYLLAFHTKYYSVAHTILFFPTLVELHALIRS